MWDTGQPAETYWTTGRVVEAMDNSYALLDLTAYGRQERWEDSPPGRPQAREVNRELGRTHGRPTAQWSRLDGGRGSPLPSRPPAEDGSGLKLGLRPNDDPPCDSAHGRAGAHDSSDSPHDCPSIWRR